MRLLVKLAAVPLIVVAVVTAALFIGAYTFLPPLVEGAAARNLQSNLGLSQTPRVELTSDPAYGMLLGRFESGNVRLEEPEFAGVRPERVRMKLDSFEMDLQQSIREGTFVPREELSGDIRVMLSEDELERIASTGVSEFPVREIGLSDGYLSVGSSTQVLGVDVPIAVRGEVDVRGGEIVYEPERASAFGTTLPRDVTDRILSGTEFGYPVEDLPFEGEITGIETGEGALALEGSVRDLPIEQR